MKDLSYRYRKATPIQALADSRMRLPNLFCPRWTLLRIAIFENFSGLGKFSDSDSLSWCHATGESYPLFFGCGFAALGTERGSVARAIATSSASTVFPRALADAGRVLGLAREPAAEPVVSLQVADLSLVGHCVFQHADEAHGYGWQWLILGLVELPRKVFSG